MEPHWATLWEHVADAVPDAPAVIHGDVRRTWRELDDRASRFAAVLGDAGIGPGARIAQYLWNSPAYVETWFGALKARVVPVNANHRYTDDELARLLDDCQAEVLVHHAALADDAARAVRRVRSLKLVLAVADDPAVLGPYDDALRSVDPALRQQRSGSDLSMLYTGGTTGAPKAVVSRIGPAVESTVASVASLAGVQGRPRIGDVPAAAARLVARSKQIVSLVACPLGHGTGLGLGMLPALAYGGCVVLLPTRRFNPDELWRVADRERARWLTIVGDPFARPMVDSLRESRRSTNGAGLSVRFVRSSGAVLSADVRAALVDLLPDAMVLDYLASSEGLMGMAVTRTGHIPPTGRFVPTDGVQVLDEHDRPVEPGGRGRVTLSVGAPERYYGDEARSATTFRVVDGVRRSFPGDWAVAEADGSLTFLGRGSQCINSGGEKVFVEEVEEAMKGHPDVVDCLVVGVADERFGECPAALIALRPGTSIPTTEVLKHAATKLARYKLPRRVVVVSAVPRDASGKPQYAAARRLVADRTVYSPVQDADAQHR